MASFVTHPSFVSWSRILEWQRSEALEKAKSEEDLRQWIKILEATNNQLFTDNTQLRAELDEKAREATNQRSRAESLEVALRSNDRIQSEELIEQNLDSVADALILAEQRFSESLAFCWNGKSEDTDSPFQKPQDVFLALRWLATIYRDARTKVRPCSDFDASLREAVVGWSYEPHQSKLTMKHAKYKAWYHTIHEGREVSLPDHLKCGSTKDARHSIRIAFTWCDKAKKVVLGYLGQHQQTSAS